VDELTQEAPQGLDFTADLEERHIEEEVYNGNAEDELPVGGPQVTDPIGIQDLVELNLKTDV